MFLFCKQLNAYGNCGWRKLSWHVVPTSIYRHVLNENHGRLLHEPNQLLVANWVRSVMLWWIWGFHHFHNYPVLSGLPAAVALSGTITRLTYVARSYDWTGTRMAMKTYSTSTRCGELFELVLDLKQNTVIIIINKFCCDFGTLCGTMKRRDGEERPGEFNFPPPLSAL